MPQTTVHRYGLQFRPCSLGAVPKGFILPYDEKARTTKSRADWSNHLTRYGFLEYPTALGSREVEVYQLNYLGTFEVETAEYYGSVYRIEAAPQE